MSIKCQPLAAGTYTVSSGFGARWGTTHYGQDYACPVGTPLYAVADGIVVQGSERPQGSVSGFGSWIWLDCQASIGQDIIYGHVDHAGILVQAGDRVTAGQIIGHSGNEGASTGPHCHVECWSAPGRLGGAAHDPAVFFADATEPGAATEPPTGGSMTSFIVDVSEHQDGMSLIQASREGIVGAIVRTTDGTYRDRCYRSHVEDAEAGGLVVAAYHYLRNPSEGTTIAQQVQVSLDVMGDLRRPMWLDCETPAGLTADHIREAKRLFEAAGAPVIGAYSYRPYWEGSMAGGEPDSHEFGAFWVAGYPGGDGTPQQIYADVGGDGAEQWAYPLGNQQPIMWQFTDRALVADHLVDCSAFRGTQDDLRALFTGGTAATDQEEDMGLTREEHDALMDCRAMLQDISAQRNGDPEITGPYGGWPQTGGRTATDMLGAIGAKLGVPGTHDTKEQR